LELVQGEFSKESCENAWTSEDTAKQTEEGKWGVDGLKRPGRGPLSILGLSRRNVPQNRVIPLDDLTIRRGGKKRDRGVLWRWDAKQQRKQGETKTWGDGTGAPGLETARTVIPFVGAEKNHGLMH